MSENNVPNMDENEELNNDILEQEVETPAEDTMEETVGAESFDAEPDAAGFDDAAITFDTAPEAAPVVKKSSTGLLISTIVLAVLLAASVLLLVVSMATNGSSLFPNKYNKMGYPSENLTVAQVADSCGMSLDEFLAACKLPADMPGSTRQSAAIYALPTGVFAQMSNLSFDQVKEMLQLPDSVTADTLWNDAQGEASLNAYVGEEEALAQFKETYGLGDEITGETTWKEVRDTVYLKDMMDQATRQWEQIMSVIEKAEDSEDAPEATDAADDTAADGSADAAATDGTAEGTPAEDAAATPAE